MRTCWQRGFGRAIVILTAVLLGYGVWTSWVRPREILHPPPESSATGTAVVAPFERAPETASPADPQERLVQSVRLLKSASGPEQGRHVFADLHRVLSRMSRDEASTLIRNWLDSGLDAPSQLAFSVGPGGFLKASSSLRVFLLDQLGQADPAAAATYARKVLDSPGTPDEWAVSLRNFARGTPLAESRAYLQQKLREMLRNEQWQTNPSVGFLEAFDVAVHTGGIELMPELTHLVHQKDNPAVAHAAYLALDRLTIQEPAAALDWLQREPDLMQGREETRANYFARANVEDPQQRAILESYLLDSHRSASELQTFAGLYPNANFSVSQNLLTRSITPTGEDLTRQDREALRVVEGWIQDPRFAGLRPRLQEVATRLRGFVARPKDSP